ncbi:MAG: putative quinol monooxygenase [Parahaliea sp.]
MLAIIAKVTLGAGSVDDYIAAAQPLVAPTLEEPGCQWYAMSRDICDPNVIWISEQWESQEHLFAHLRTAHIKNFIEVTSRMEVLSLEARQYEVSSVGPVHMPED